MGNSPRPEGQKALTGEVLREPNTNGWIAVNEGEKGTQSIKNREDNASYGVRLRRVSWRRQHG